MTHSAKTPNRVSGSPFGPVLIGFAGAVGLALLMLATGHGLLMAFLAYSLSGALCLVAGAAGRSLVEAAAHRFAPALGARGPLRGTA